MWNGPCGTRIFLPRISDRHRCHSDCLSITQITPPARQIDADLFAGGEGFIMWSVENVECGIWSVERVPLDVEWVYNGEHGAKRLCLYGAKSDNGIKKCAPMGRLERKKSYLCCKKVAPITARHDDRQGGRGRGTSSGSMAWLNPMTFLDPMT